MTRKDFSGYAKKYGFAVLCALPVLIALDFWLIPLIGNVWVVVVDCALLLLAFAVALLISRLWSEHITKKRTEFLNQKEMEKRQKLVEEAQSEEEPQQTKIWQKQKKNYPSKKRKK